MNNGFLKGGLIFLAGAAMGALTTLLLTKGQDGVKPAVAGLVAGGLNLKDKTLTVFEKAKENLEDIVAEAEHLRTDPKAETKASSKKPA